MSEPERTEAPKRLRQSDIIERLLERGPARAAVPEIEVTQKHTPQGRAVTDRRVYIPVCEEFPTAAEAVAATIAAMRELREAFPDDDDSLGRVLEASVKRLDPSSKSPTRRAKPA